MLWAKDWGRAELTLVVSTLLLKRFRGLGVTQQTKGQDHLEACSLTGLAVDARYALGLSRELWTRAPPQGSCQQRSVQSNLWFF